jgi:hypothetical protein
MSDSPVHRFPLLEQFLQMKGMSIQASYSNADAAFVFACSAKTIRNYINKGLLKPRQMPGKQTFLPNDLEELLAMHRKV